MNELTDKIKPIEDTFLLLSKVTQLDKLLNSQTTFIPNNNSQFSIGDLNVIFKNTTDEESRQVYEVVFKDKLNKEVFTINLQYSDAKPQITLQVNKEVMEKTIASKGLSVVLFDEVLININNKIKDTIEEKEKIAFLPKPTVTGVLDKINKMRTDSNNTKDKTLGYRS